MSKKWLFRRPFHKQHSKGAQTLLPSGRKHLNHIYWLLWRQLSWKKRSLVLRKSLRLFVDWLTADDKCSLLNKGNLKQPIQILLSEKKQTFSQFFSAFLKSTLNFEYFEKKPMYFRNWRLPKTWLDKCLNSPVLEHSSTSNMINGPKHCCNLDHRTFTIFFDQCKGGKIQLEKFFFSAIQNLASIC